MRLPIGRLHTLIRRFGYEVSPRPLTRLVRSFDPDLVIDVGANEGQFGRELRAAGYDGRIVSFEPHPDAFRRLGGPVASDPMWDARNEALGAEEGVLNLHVADKDATSSLLSPASALADYAASVRFTGTVPVPVRRLDAVFDDVRRGAGRVALKVDTQGYERAVIEGAGFALDEVGAVFLELSFVPLYEGEPPAEEVIGHLRTRGFVPAYLSPAFTEAGTRRWIQADVLFLREASRHRP